MLDMKIPQIDPFIGDEEYKAIKQCFVDKWITEGPRTKLLEEKPTVPYLYIWL